jgi:predicted ATPase/class 3 adenylate cyclase
MPDLPTGIVTFLFTDVEGSTRLIERLGQQYRDVQVAHDAIVRSAIRAGEGVEVSTEGDAFFAVFRSPLGAIRAVAQAQREIAVTPWPAAADVRVRMGLHTGEGILGGDDYLGLDVNRTARIASAAHGGQVLISDSTRALVERGIPSGTRLKDLGLHRLKDLGRPEHLHQLTIDGVDGDFPPPRTLDARPNNLPAQLTRFIGRSGEIATIRDLLGESRLVTLTGPGGTGKTRLALQSAAELLVDVPDGVFFVDLSPLTDPELVAQAIADALRARGVPGRGALDALTEHLQDKDLVLVLDNFEHVLAAGPAVLVPLLQAAPGIRALATSRVPLHVYGEREYPVPPLELPDPDRVPGLEVLARFEAVALFVERAAAVKPGFRVTTENARTVVEITARLDGLPLAIELAASRLKLLSPDRLLERLQRSLPILVSHERNVPERQRTLRRTIEWSYDLLVETERRMFARLTVFAGGADLEAVDVVVNPQAELGLDTLDGLASLVDKNLVRAVDSADGERRFTMLETIREFGLERLSESNEEPTIRRRHAEHWAVVGERSTEGLFGSRPSSPTRGLKPDLDNVRSALGWVMAAGEADIGLRLGAALREFGRGGGHVREGLGWLRELLALPQAAARTQLRARALTSAADLSSWIGETESYLAFAEEAVSIYRELDDRDGIPDALEELGLAQMFVGRPEAARDTLTEAKELQLGLGNRQKAGECTLALGMVALIEGHADQARQPVTEALATFDELADPYWSAYAGRLLGGLDRNDGDYAAAEQRFRLSLLTSQEHDLPMVMASDLYAFADLALAREAYERAIRLMGATQALRDRVGEPSALETAIVGDVLGAARAFLDEATADRAFDEGRRMGHEEMVAYALT